MSTTCSARAAACPTTCGTCRSKATLRSFRSGKPGAIKGGIAFYEGQLDDARHTMMIARTAADYGAAVATSVRVTSFVRDGDAVVGAVATRSGVGHASSPSGRR